MPRTEPTADAMELRPRDGAGTWGSDWTPRPSPPLMASDVVEIARLALLLPLSWAVPVWFWSPIARAFAHLDGRLRRGLVAERVAHVARVLGGAPAAASPQRIVREWLAANHESRLQVLRDHRPGRWRPHIDIVGLEHIEDGLRAGRGVVLWVDNFAFSSHVTKMALSRAGVAVSHLSRPTHGFSGSWFGIRALNPIQTRVEDRYLRERLTVTPGTARRVWRRIQDKLGANEVISITVGDQARRVARPRLLGGRLRLATGPAYLACTTGAALLPVFTIRDGEGRYVVDIGPPLAAESTAGDGACVDAIVAAFVARLAPVVLRHPGQWRNWSIVEVD